MPTTMIKENVVLKEDKDHTSALLSILVQEYKNLEEILSTSVYAGTQEESSIFLSEEPVKGALNKYGII
jgi:hypothetical protein